MESTQPILEVIDENGQKQSVEIVFSYQDEITQKEYVIYTKNEKMPNDMVVLYASLITVNDNTMKFENISDDEWNMLKGRMRDAIHN